MAGINLRGETSGSVEITSPAVAGDTTITLPTTNGTLVVEQTDRVSFASSVGIGTTNPQQPLHVYASGDNIILLESSDRYADIIQADTGGSTRLRSDQGELQFYSGGDASSEQALNSTERLRITSGGNIQVNGGNVQIDDNGEFALFEDDTSLAMTNSSKISMDFASNVARIRSSHNGSAVSRPLAFFIGSSERLRITSGGNVGINTDNPAHMLALHTVNTTGYSTATGDTANPNTLLHLENQNGNDNAGVDNYVAAEFSVGRGATSQGWLGYTRTANNQGAFFIKQRNAASSYPETIRFPSSGGVTFGGGANTANTLDDYEEGTFTPEFANAASGGTESGSYHTQNGRYTKIGNLVHVDIYLKDVDTTGLGTGQFFIRGLPFTVKNGSIHIGTAGLSDVDLNSTASALYSFANATSGAISALRVFQTKDNTGHSAVPCDAVNDGDNEIFISMTYPTA